MALIKVFVNHSYGGLVSFKKLEDMLLLFMTTFLIFLFAAITVYSLIYLEIWGVNQTLVGTTGPYSFSSRIICLGYIVTG